MNCLKCTHFFATHPYTGDTMPTKCNIQWKRESLSFLTQHVVAQVRRLLSMGSFAIKKPIPLQLAVNYGLLHITKVLLNQGAQQGDNLMWCCPPLLEIAIKRENLEMVKLLLDQDKIDPNIGDPRKQQTPCPMLCTRGLRRL